MEHPLDDQECHTNHHKKNQKLCSESEVCPLSLKESQWKLRPGHDLNSPMEERPLHY